MKLLILLSVIAYGYADKLDRAYLPPLNAATAGGSPGSLLAPGLSGRPGSSSGQVGPAFGQGLPSGRQSGSGSTYGPSGPTYGGVSGNIQNGPGFGTGVNKGPAGFNQEGTSGINQFQTGAGGNVFAPGANGKVPLLGANAPFGSLQGNFGSNPVAGAYNVGSQQAYGPQSGAPLNQGFGKGTQGFNVPQDQAYRPERPQAAADRNAEILKYVNENNGESYLYSYETSNGISAEESGVATNGVKAQGGFSYTGDDGQAYSLTYTADENGFQPQGEHLPTPHPIPEEILKSIEDNARAAAAGTQEGAYRPEEYESEGPQQYNVGQTSFNRPQGQGQGFTQGSFSKGPATQAQSNQFPTNQGAFGPSGQSGQAGQTSQGSNQFGFGPSGLQGQISQYQQTSGSNQGPVSQFGQSGQIGQVKPSPGSSPFATGQAKPQGQRQNGQYQTGIGSSQGPFRQSSGQGSIGQGLGQTSQGLGSTGYNYNQPQNAFGSATQFGSSGSGQNLPQANQGQTTSTFESQNGQGSFGLQSGKLPSSETPFGPSQIGLGQSQNFNKPGSQATGSAGTFGPGQNQLNANKPFGSSQGSQVRPGSQGSSSPTASGSSGYQYEANANRPSFGNRPSGISSQPSKGSQYQPSANQPSTGAYNGIEGSTQFGSTGPNGQIGQGQQNGNRPFGGTGTNQGSSPFGGSSGTQKPGTGSVFGQVNQPLFGSNVGPSQGASQFGLGSQQSTSAQGPSGPKNSLLVQAPYQYDRPSQSFPPQQRPGSPGFPGVNGASVGSQGIDGQRPGVNVRPGGSSPGSQGAIGNRPGYTGAQGANGRPAFTGTQGVNGQGPDGSAPGSQGVNGQRPSSPGLPEPSQGNQGRQEQFGGPRQPPSFSAQEGYKY
ncbi:collagen alpha-2(I) chain-like [Maniola jurtina]|uniref:collagen alpha-2(I) chain-like n=1 Tax=Maniola jurtina TaxID=191418 RepID=UPI001E68F70E|nr:collagen alpha-2(I) chain-like [Maniola jurtina]